MPKTTYCNLSKLKHRLNIQPVNTGRQFSLGGRNGIVTDDMEALHAMLSMSGDCINLISGVEFSFTEYRGQTQEYEVCLSSLDRITRDHELFAALCRSTYFQQALASHPAITQLQSFAPVLDQRVQPLPICINLEGIAQHYGLPTEHLDITSNFSVASFFATQRWDDKAKKFEPMRMLSNPGVIYKLHPILSIDPTIKPDEMPYVPVGWQPFPRPEQQRANAIRLKPGEDFAQTTGVVKYRFYHSRNQSKRIYEEFEGGDTLMPADDLANFADSLHTKTAFPQSTLDLAFERYNQRKPPQDTAAKRQSLMTQAGITLEKHVSFEPQEWGFNQAVFEAEIERMCNYQRLLSICGYGVPSLDRALFSARNTLTLISQAELQPFAKENSKYTTRDMHFYELPWPKDVLQALPDDVDVKMKVTLS